jgi:isoquinoline 1-oxidoreductase alpha subunit
MHHSRRCGAGKRVTTIGAVGATAAGKKIQQAWIELEVPQCGCCQSGQIFAATGTRLRKPPVDTAALKQSV